MQSIPRFYVYVLCRPDGRPFYVGKGQGQRINDHERLARQGHKAHRYNIIRKIWREGGQVSKQKVFETYNEDEAFTVERDLIASIGRENLANETDGGEGVSGWDRPLEWYEKVQAAKIGKPRSDECKQKIRDKLTGRELPREHVEHATAGHRGQKRSIEARQRISDGLRGTQKPNLQGEKHHQARLTADQVREIRRQSRAGVTRKELAQRYGVAVPTIDSIIYRQTWRHLLE